ncbi:class F sortase [Streptomyces ferrugineus]|uniref:Class F sortase n=1 Tax=Streptomyces ferrugineus TaxID=1413221 RepID=A0A7M2SUN5_9ACTN|nr:class F sortase [Streptomyces ferrugineus]QOV39385.1 class F sortase [Streptomyces ferrugineus]
MARRRRRRPWYRRRAYRLARTAVLAVSLVVVGVRCNHAAPGAGTAAPGSAEASEVRAAGTGSGAGGAGADSRPGTGAPPADAPETTPAPPATPGGTAGTTAPASTPAPPSPSPSPQPARTGKAAKRPGGPRPLPRSRATRLVVPYVSIDAPVTDLRLDSERRLPAPPEDEPNLVGWFADGPSPGEPGTAIAVGHLDTDTGPAVFGGLGELKRGKRIEVRRADGRTAVYSVDAIKTYEKDKFPNREVYGARSRPELRLITCGGNYNRKTGYTGNVVVYAHLTATREPKGAGRR